MPTAAQPKPTTIYPLRLPDLGSWQPHTGQMYLRYCPEEKREGPPSQMLLGTLNNFGFRVTTAIPVDFEFGGQTVIATWREIDEFGTGVSVSAACEDLGHTVAELYQSLEKDQDRLGADLSRVWGVLRQHVTRRR